MLVEALVLGGEDGLFHHLRDFLDVDDGAALLAELAEEVAFGARHPQRDLRLVVGEHVERRQRGPQQGQHEGAEQAADHGEAEARRR